MWREIKGAENGLNHRRKSESPFLFHSKVEYLVIALYLFIAREPNIPTQGILARGTETRTVMWHTGTRQSVMCCCWITVPLKLLNRFLAVRRLLIQPAAMTKSVRTRRNLSIVWWIIRGGIRAASWLISRCRQMQFSMPERNLMVQWVVSVYNICSWLPEGND